MYKTNILRLFSVCHPKLSDAFLPNNNVAQFVVSTTGFGDPLLSYFDANSVALSLIPNQIVLRQNHYRIQLAETSSVVTGCSDVNTLLFELSYDASTEIVRMTIFFQDALKEPLVIGELRGLGTQAAASPLRGTAAFYLDEIYAPDGARLPRINLETSVLGILEESVKGSTWAQLFTTPQDAVVMTAVCPVVYFSIVDESGSPMVVATAQPQIFGDPSVKNAVVVDDAYQGLVLYYDDKRKVYHSQCAVCEYVSPVLLQGNNIIVCKEN